MKPVQFEGDSLKRLRGFPREVRHDLGLQLYRLQHAFQKKTQATNKQDIELAATRYAALLRRNR